MAPGTLQSPCGGGSSIKGRKKFGTITEGNDIAQNLNPRSLTGTGVFSCSSTLPGEISGKGPDDTRPDDVASPCSLCSGSDAQMPLFEPSGLSDSEQRPGANRAGRRIIPTERHPQFERLWPLPLPSSIWSGFRSAEANSIPRRRTSVIGSERTGIQMTI